MLLTQCLRADRATSAFVLRLWSDNLTRSWRRSCIKGRVYATSSTCGPAHLKRGWSKSKLSAATLSASAKCIRAEAGMASFAQDTDDRLRALEEYVDDEDDDIACECSRHDLLQPVLESWFVAMERTVHHARRDDRGGARAELRATGYATGRSRSRRASGASGWRSTRSVRTLSRGSTRWPT